VTALADFFELPGHFVQFCEYIAQFCVVGTAWHKTGAISFPESSDESIAVLPADVTVLLAVSHNRHCDHLL
jgi:hypothetical protein